MMKVEFHNGYVYLKNNWSEINEDDFLFLMEQFAGFAVGKLTKIQVQTNWLFHTCNVTRKYTDEDKYLENIYQIAREFHFLFDENEKPNLDFEKFYITRLKHIYKIYNGPTFEIKCGIPVTSITAEQFVDAFSVYLLYDSDKKPETLHLLVSILFCNPYLNKKAIIYSPTFKYINAVKVYGVYIQFMALLRYCSKSFPFLFYETIEQKTVGYNLGFAETMYSVVEAGYGSQREVAEMNLFDFLNILTKKRLEVIRMMKQHKKNSIEIHNETGIPFELIETV